MPTANDVPQQADFHFSAQTVTQAIHAPLPLANSERVNNCYYLVSPQPETYDFGRSPAVSYYNEKANTFRNSIALLHLSQDLLRRSRDMDEFEQFVLNAATRKRKSKTPTRLK